MRSRTGSGVRLDRILFMVEHTIFKYQNAITGLFANEKEFPGHAWVRDNVYVIHALWALYRAYMKCAEFDEDLNKANELGLTWRSLLECMMRQAEKVEMFKKYQRSVDALHAKYSVSTKGTVCGDTEWGHLQIDATSLFLLTLAQITASGLQVVRNFDEVAFIQNLVYYIETGYRTPDFGIWERGDKTNQGIRELNASSIGMVKAALQAMNDVGDLFGDGSRRSAIHVLPDEIEQCSAVLSSMLPRESFSKETDAALLTIISYPGFSVEDAELVECTRDTITSKLLGKYGCRRFLRDGYKTALEDPYRLYYNKSELQQFENIECEWPLFLCFLLLDAMYNKNDDEVEEYWRRLESVAISSEKGFRLIPELYKIEREHVAGEKSERGSQPRVPAGATPYLWAQSLYVICCLLYEGFLSPAELDPLSRRMSSQEKRPPCEVQVTILAETKEVQSELLANGISVQCVDEIDPVFTILPASSLAEIHAVIGQSKKLNLSGRPLDRDVGLLSTSRLYQIGDKFVIFTPQFMDSRRSHLMYDIRILMDEWSSELQYIYASWNSVSISGKPLVVLLVNNDMLTTDGLSSFSNISLNRFMKSTVLGTIKKINTGYLGGARVVMRDLSDFFRTTAVSKLEFNNSEWKFPSGECKTNTYSLLSDAIKDDRNGIN
ncbi:phosphorylase kinase alpha/beta [Dictyocaulus viviparus]|uniref:Phosphorylase b kinase regulatory subunit n=1 Tax=Dictyocaulus viviparus TaxID=29172 RepID=A0A0D8XPG6_DICVI|nr:phosphorylase kinase alpha/beta [Dictyocaulus viviparus]